MSSRVSKIDRSLVDSLTASIFWMLNYENTSYPWRTQTIGKHWRPRVWRVSWRIDHAQATCSFSFNQKKFSLAISQIGLYSNVQETYSFIIIYKEQCWKFCLKGYTNYFKKTKYILYKFSIANNIVLKVTANFPNQYYFWIFGTMSENFVLLPFFQGKNVITL